MFAGRIVVVSGPPGAGKSTLTDRLAAQSAAERSIRLHADDLVGYIQKGFIKPGTPDADPQGAAMTRANIASALSLARDGYEVFVDGIVHALRIPMWRDAAGAGGFDLRYVLLMPDEATTVARAIARTDPGAMRDGGICSRVWARFRDQPPPPDLTFDSSGQTVEETLTRLRAELASGRFRPF